MIGDGRKIPREYENPIDNVLIDITHALNPLYRSLGLTPNILTTFSWMCAIGGLWLYKKAPKGSRAVYVGVCVYFVGYFFDCADGNMARTDHRSTSFGDMYDHFSDILTFLGTVIVLWTILPRKDRVRCGVLIGVLCLAMLVQFGCQERMYHKWNPGAVGESPVLNMTQMLCMCPDERIHSVLKYTRFVGGGTFFVVVCVVMLRLKG